MRPAWLRWARALPAAVPLLVATACGPAALTGSGAPAATAPGPAVTAAPTPDVAATVQAALLAASRALQPTSTPGAAASATPTVALLTDDTWRLAAAEGARYQGVAAVLTGQVARALDLDPAGAGFELYLDPGHKAGLAIVAPPPATQVEVGAYVRVKGAMAGVYEGRDAGGATVHGPLLRATQVEVLTREAAVAPALKTAAVQQRLEQHGLSITLQRVEWAQRETRCYVSVANGSTEAAAVAARGAKLVQGSRQFESLAMDDPVHPPLPDELVPGVTAETVLVFGPADPAQPLRLFWDGMHLLDTNPKFQPYQWTVNP